jgi:serine/threonine protein kinase
MKLLQKADGSDNTLNNNYIIKPIEVMEEKDDYGNFVYNIIMEQFEGMQLREFFNQEIIGKKVQLGTPQWNKRVKDIVMKILTAVAYLHKHGIMHRDLKFENILIDPTTNDIRIIDFGFARQRKSKDFPLRHENEIGTPSHYAPEVIKEMEGDFSVLKKCDVWSIGIVTHRLFMGRRPFTLPGTEKVQENLILTEDVSISPHEGRLGLEDIMLDIKLGNQIKNMLKKNPKNRPSASDVLLSLTSE